MRTVPAVAPADPACSRNDVLINAFGLFTSSAGVKLAWWIDPLGAILISSQSSPSAELLG